MTKAGTRHNRVCARCCSRAAVLVVLLAGFGFPVSSLAQRESRVSSNGGLFDAGFASLTVDGYARSSLTDVASSLWGATGRLSGIGTASIARFESGHATGYGEVHGSVALSPDTGNLAAFKLDGGGGSYRGRASSGYVETSIVLGRSARGGATAAWLHAGVGAVSGSASHHTAHTAAGASVRSGSAIFDVALNVVGVASTRYADAVMNAQWALFRNGPLEGARFVAGIGAGMRSGGDVGGRRAWLNGSATLRVGGPVSLVAYAGAQPSDAIRGTPGVAFTSMSMRIALGALAVSRSPLEAKIPQATSVSTEGSDGRRVVTVLLPQAQSVELMGDFTDWRPVVMTRSTSGIWQARVTLSQGSHRMNVRSDSEPWATPPGLPVAPDDFGGSVGILLVP